MDRSETFEYRKCWQLAYILKMSIKKEIINKLPSTEKYDFMPQLIRVAGSATPNIAASWGRYNFLDSNKFCNNSRGSVCEILDHAIEARDKKYISDEV